MFDPTVFDFSDDKHRTRQAVEAFLTKLLDTQTASQALEAARYTTLGGGHRWRPIVTVAAGRIFDADALDIVLPAACGIELAHAASLILDDLPSMDDGRLRRGKPCVHLVYPRWATDMAPVLMVTLAFSTGLDNPRTSEERRVRSALVLGQAGQAMICGQTLDVVQENGKNKSDRLLQCYLLKSAALYAAAAECGAILCGGSADECARIAKAGELLGMAYQFMDDVADATATAQQLGKETGQDADKFTTIDWIGVDGARRMSETYQGKALAELEGFGSEADWFRTLVCEASWASK